MPSVNNELTILCVAPFAPPVNHAEPIQVGRYLKQLLKTDRVKLICERPWGSWSTIDPELEISDPRLQRNELALPFHSLAMRSLTRLRIGDERWSLGFSHSVARSARPFDLIYTRSMPFRAALFGARLKALTNKPWIMHLSDPWADSPYARDDVAATARAQAEEHACFTDSDAVSVTTPEVAAYYRRKYPALADRIFVSPNVFQECAQRRSLRPVRGGRLRMVYTGALYGDRSPKVLIDAIQRLPQEDRDRMQLIVAGNATPEIVALMLSAGSESIRYEGPKSFADALKLQETADLLVTLENGGAHELDGTFLLSKLLDYLPVGIPLLSITGQGSVTDRIVAGNYGWAVSPANQVELSNLLRDLLAGKKSEEQKSFSSRLPDELKVEPAVLALRQKMLSLVGRTVC